ncbi:hypothetical protein BH09MYX1_BH09MYX1_46010 [soil metagenome]
MISWRAIFSAPKRSLRRDDRALGRGDNFSDAGGTKLDQNGVIVWQRSFAGVYSVATDASGAIFVVGASEGPTDFGGGAVSATGYFVAKYSANGVYQWVLGPFPTVIWTHVVVRANGNVVAVGALEAPQNLGSATISPNGAADALFLELTSSGTYVSAKAWGDSGRQEIDSITIDGSGNFVMVGYAEGSIDFGGGAMTGPLNAGSHNAFIVKLDGTGAFVKQRGTGSTGQDHFRAVTIDSSGRVLVVGSLSTTMTFGGATKTPVSPADIVIAALDTNLTEVWSRQYGSTGTQLALGMAADPGGGFAIAGFANGDLSFGLGGLPPNVQFPYVARFDANGNPVSNFAPTGNVGTIGLDVAYLTSGDYVFAGRCVPVQVGFPWGSMYCPENSGNAFVTRMRP